MNNFVKIYIIYFIPFPWILQYAHIKSENAVGIRVVGLEPTRLTAEEPKSSESTISTIPAYMSDSAFCRYFAVL